MKIKIIVNWGKLVGILLAILFIYFSFHTLQTDYYLAIQQIRDLTSAQNNLVISTVSSNKTNIVLNVKNPLNISVIIYNITGDYVYLQKPYIIPPHSSKNVVLIVTNYLGLANNIKNNSESLTISLRILNTTISEVETL